MFIFEHDAKVLLEAFGTAVPQGCWVGAGGIVDGTLPTGALIVKAQVAGGGRGKAGGIQRAADAPAALEAAGQLMAAPLMAAPLLMAVPSLMAAPMLMAAPLLMAVGL